MLVKGVPQCFRVGCLACFLWSAMSKSLMEYPNLIKTSFTNLVSAFDQWWDKELKCAEMQYLPQIMQTVLLCFVVLWLWFQFVVDFGDPFTQIPPAFHRRHNRRDSVSNHQHHDCLLNRLFRRRSKKSSKFCVTGHCAGNSPGTGEFPAQMASYVENVSIRWRHYGDASWVHVTVVVRLPQYTNEILNRMGEFALCLTTIELDHARTICIIRGTYKANVTIFRNM